MLEDKAICTQGLDQLTTDELIAEFYECERLLGDYRWDLHRYNFIKEIPDEATINNVKFYSTRVNEILKLFRVYTTKMLYLLFCHHNNKLILKEYDNNTSIYKTILILIHKSITYILGVGWGEYIERKFENQSGYKYK